MSSNHRRNRYIIEMERLGISSGRSYNSRDLYESLILKGGDTGQVEPCHPSYSECQVLYDAAVLRQWMVKKKEAQHELRELENAPKPGPYPSRQFILEDPYRKSDRMTRLREIISQSEPRRSGDQLFILSKHRDILILIGENGLDVSQETIDMCSSPTDMSSIARLRCEIIDIDDAMEEAIFNCSKEYGAMAVVPPDTASWIIHPVQDIAAMIGSVQGDERAAGRKYRDMLMAVKYGIGEKAQNEKDWKQMFQNNLEMGTVNGSFVDLKRQK